MKIAVIGQGAREHALAWKIKKSPKTDELFIIPGNAGTRNLGKNIDIPVDDIPGIIDWVKKNKIDLVVIGPEAPLSCGLADEIKKNRIKVFGPGKDGAELEASKAYSKNFMKKYGIPTAKYGCFENFQDAKEYLNICEFPLVIKADGLAAGKGVTIAKNADEALGELTELLIKSKFKESSKKVIIEEFLKGREISILCFTDGEVILPMEGACDYKKAHDEDKGPNTGGMGAYSPSEFLDEKLFDTIKDTIIIPTLNGLKKEGVDYCGVIYFGLMITGTGPMVLEYNARFGDPETQVILTRLDNDLVEIMLAAADKKLHTQTLKWKDDAALTVVISAEGYPGNYKKNIALPVLEEKEGDIIVFHAGTKLENEKTVSSGGRVLSVTSLAPSLDKAREKVYSYINGMNWEGFHYRKDIGNIKGAYYVR
ncbi:MAG: phosphoribosylamine--glycine ligase [Armatimonadota bacterium]